MNEHLTNEQYFSKETAERLPSESRRRQLMVAELKELKQRKSELQKELDDFINSVEYGVEPTAEQIAEYCRITDKMDSVSTSICFLKMDIERLDAGETLADIYRSTFGA